MVGARDARGDDGAAERRTDAREARRMSERTLRTYGALLESRARGDLSDAERGAGERRRRTARERRATTRRARTRARRANDRREALEDAAWLEAREREKRTWRERANEATRERARGCTRIYGSCSRCTWRSRCRACKR